MLRQVAWIVVLMGAMAQLPGAVAGASSAAGASSNEPVTKAKQSDIDTAVRLMTAQIAADLSKNGPIAWIRYFDDDPGFLMASDGKLEFDGLPAAKSFLSEFAKHITHIEITWAHVRVDPLAPGLATLAASYDEALTDTQGHIIRPHGYFTGVVVQKADGWKLRSLHWSSPGSGV